MADFLSMLLISLGLFFFLVGAIGVIRFPDALTRAHGAAKSDTLGAALCIVGLMIKAGFTPVSFKLMLIIFFLWTANPTAAHMVAKAITVKKMTEER